MRSQTTSAVANFLVTIPQAERERLEAFADALLEEAGEQLADVADKAVNQAAEEMDFDTPAEEAIARELRGIDLGQRIDDALEEAGLEDLAERCEESLELAMAATKQADDDAAHFRDVTRGGFFRRLRWLVTGR